MNRYSEVDCVENIFCGVVQIIRKKKRQSKIVSPPIIFFDLRLLYKIYVQRLTKGLPWLHLSNFTYST